MPHSWVPYESGSAVQSAIAMAAALKDQNVDIITMHQGYEETEISGDLAPLRTYGGTMAGKYNPAGGHGASVKAFAGFARDFLGLPNEYCFTAQANGRVGLGHAFLLTSQLYQPEAYKNLRVLVPNSRWPMVDAKATQVNLGNLVSYDVTRGQIADNICRALEEYGDSIAALYTNFPHNPTGLVTTDEEMQRIQSTLDTINQTRAASSLPPIVHIADDPYFMSLDSQDTVPYIKSPYAGKFQIDGPTPSVHLISFSKCLGMANPGFYAVVLTNSKMAADYKKFLTTDIGPAFVPEFCDHVTKILSEQSYPALKDHFKKIKQKYIVNNQIFEDLVPGALDGDPGMTRAFAVPDDVLNKQVQVNGQAINIKTTRDVAAYIANVTGTILVAQSIDGAEKLLRIALKSENPDLVRQACEGIATSFDQLRKAPSIAAAA